MNLLINPEATLDMNDITTSIEEQRIDDSAQQGQAVTIYKDDLALV